jgi:hypothetical protein
VWDRGRGGDSAGPEAAPETCDDEYLSLPLFPMHCQGPLRTTTGKGASVMSVELIDEEVSKR